MSPSAPDFSIIVPTFARPERLACCLEALACLDYTRDRFEVVVADDGSPSPVAPALEPFRDRLNLRLLRQDNAGPATARNAAARAARGKFLAFTDDDCTPRPSWLAAFAAGFRHEPLALLGGRTENALPGNVYARTSQQLVDYLYEYYGAADGDAPYFTSNNMAVQRETFLGLGGFDQSFPLAAAEDREFGVRWRDRVGPLRYVADAVVDHAHALTLRRFWGQHANYGRGARHLARVLRARGARPHKLEPARFYVRMMSHPLTESRSLGALAGTSLIVLSQVAMTWGYAGERWRERGAIAGRNVRMGKAARR